MTRHQPVLLDLYGERIDLDAKSDFALVWNALRHLFRILSPARFHTPR